MQINIPCSNIFFRKGNYPGIFILLLFVMTGSLLNARIYDVSIDHEIDYVSIDHEIDYVSIDHETDDLSTYLVTFSSYYHSGTGHRSRFSADDTLRYSFEWDFGDGRTGSGPVVMHRYETAGTYYTGLTVTDLSDPLRVITSEIIPVTVDDSFEVPNVFTPDGDGVNDSFIVRSNGVTPLTITIFDRGGSIVYRHTSPVINWDGRNPGGTRVRPGVYYYVITSPEPLYNKNGFVHIFYNR